MRLLALPQLNSPKQSPLLRLILALLPLLLSTYLNFPFLLMSFLSYLFFFSCIVLGSPHFFNCYFRHPTVGSRFIQNNTNVFARRYPNSPPTYRTAIDNSTGDGQGYDIRELRTQSSIMMRLQEFWTSEKVCFILSICVLFIYSIR